MGANLTPIDKSMTKEKAISQGGYYNTDGDWNCIVTDENYPGKVLRGRVEVLVLKDGKLFMFLRDNGIYRIPGGGFDKGILNKDQAFIETKEEAKLIIENIRYTGVTYIHLYDELWGNSENAILYDGTYNEVYIADYKDEFHGYIRKGLSDMELTRKGKFYELKDVENILKEPHKQALMNMLNGVIKESVGDDLITVARELQKTLKGYHDVFDILHCIQNRDIESDDSGYIFAEYNANTKSEISDVKSFMGFCSNKVKEKVYTAYIEEPVSYKGHGFISIKNQVHEHVNDYEVIEEANIFKNDKVFNIDNFINGKSNILLVTGLPGAGKTTLTSDLAHEYNAKVITLDYFQNFDIAKKEFPNDITTKYIEEYLSITNNISEDIITNNITVENYGNYFEPFLFWLINKLEQDKDNTYIIEGVHILLFSQFSRVKDYPLICIETSKSKSIVRHWIRDGWTVKDILRYGYKDIKLYNKWDKSKKRFFTEAAKDSKDDKYPIFIVNTYTGTTMGKIIKSYTHSVYTHSALSLDTSLENLYSFNGNNGVNKRGGFSRESLSSYIDYNENCKIQVNCIFVTKEDLNKVKDRLDYLMNNQKYTKYNFGNLFNIVLNKSIETGKDATAMVCSQFVSYILSVADIRLLDKSINLITPKDLSTITNPKVYLLYEGLGINYDKNSIDRIFRKLKIKSHLVK